jgi:hypothetical protein
MANNSISLVNLDFDTLKSQLKTYLKGQAQFSDYDFDGSNMSVLLDILTYNSHLNAFYLNMVASEMFLDSAQLRNSAVSIAKALNYTPRSSKSSRAVLDLVFPLSGLQRFEIPENTRFTAKNSRGSFQFLTTESLILYPSNGAFRASNVSVYEGSLITESFIVDYSVEGQRFILSNESIDTDSTRVVVSEDQGQTNTRFTPVTSLFGLTSNSDIYFLQATDDSRYELVFGDGVFGRRPKDSAAIIATYRNTAGAAGDECTNFILADNLGSINGFGSAIIPNITVVSPSSGGDDQETIDEIRFRAPRAYQTQDRAVTPNDFESLVVQQFQYVKSVRAYGGEQSSGTPAFGKVFIVPLTFSGNIPSLSQKTDIQSFLKARSTIGIDPVVIDPDYLYIEVDTTASYSDINTTQSAADIEASIKQAIEDYNDSELVDFNTELKLSRLETAINVADPSIQTNTTELTMRKNFRAVALQRTFPSVTFRNEIVPGTITSSDFISQGSRFEYTDFNPSMQTLSVNVVDNKTTITNSTNVVYLKNVTNPAAVSYSPAGTVDYVTGTLALNAITVTSLEGNDGILFYAKPLQQDIQSIENDVLAIDIESGITVSVRKA